MKIHVLQHAWFEGIGLIQEWVDENDHEISYTRLYQDEAIPDTLDFELLIIMGGPMSISETDKYPWLKPEKNFIKKAIESDRAILGICLGAQLLAEALGAKVYKGPHKEIGWFPVQWAQSSFTGGNLEFLPKKTNVFHWHGETFDIPDKAIHIAHSEAFPNQAFLYNKKVLALQFHLEVNNEACNKMVDNCSSDITPGKWVQHEDEIINSNASPTKNAAILKQLLDSIND